MNIEGQPILNRVTTKHVIAAVAVILSVTFIGAYFGSKQGTLAALSITLPEHKCKDNDTGVVSATCSVFCPRGTTPVPCN